MKCKNPEQEGTNCIKTKQHYDILRLIHRMTFVLGKRICPGFCIQMADEHLKVTVNVSSLDG